MSDAVKNLLVKIREQEEVTLQAEKKERAIGKNTRRVRRQVIKIAHYYHLLQNHGDKYVAEKVEQFCELAKIKIREAKDYDGRWREIAELCLIDEHTRAWNLAEYYYEKATKILCQMTITLMDYILQEQTGISILYNGMDKSGYYDLLEEITELNSDYVDCCCFLSSYDYCAKKIADFTEIVEYRQLVKEHERIMTNGMPGRVTDAMKQLKEISEERDTYYIMELFNSYTPNPPYCEDDLEKQYLKAVAYYGDEIKAMTNFFNLVIKVDEYYGTCIKKQQGKINLVGRGAQCGSETATQ